MATHTGTPAGATAAGTTEERPERVLTFSDVFGRDAGGLIVLLILFGAMTLASSEFLTGDNLANLARQVAHVTRLIRGGGTVVTGTDSPIVPTAVSTHMNLRGMVQYGATPWEAMSSATRVPGEFLDLPLGRLAPGYFADLAVLGGDPLTDIRQAANVQQVMANGVLHTPASLMSPFTASPRKFGQLIRNKSINDGYWWHDPHWVESSRHACCSDD